MDSHPQEFPFGIMTVAELLHLNVRRRLADSAYVDCPFCGDKRGKMNVNFSRNVWRCNYCGESGGMLALYARLNNMSNSQAYHEIWDALSTGEASWGCEDYGISTAPAAAPVQGAAAPGQGKGGITQSPPASAQEVHRTFSRLFEMLTLSAAHRNHLRSEKRGLTDEQIKQFGFKSTPPYFLCRSLTERLIGQGCTVAGVPGFYQHENGYWTVKFTSRTSGILIPAVGMDGLIRGAQIMLDTPIRDKNDPPDKSGAKYIWLSSSSKNMGTTSGSPVHFVGKFPARTVYVTEGLLKADIAHCLINRSIVTTAGANNVGALGEVFRTLALEGTELIIEAQDMDKYRNANTAKGSSKIYLMAKEHGMECRRLTWDPNFKGIDDWQLGLRKKERQREEERKDSGDADIPQDVPETKCFLQKYRVYQLDFGREQTPIPFAFEGIKELHKAGYGQPPAKEYRLMWDSALPFPENSTDKEILKRIKDVFSVQLPDGYRGRQVAPSDVLELYDDEKRSYYYVDTGGFEPVRFSPFLAKPMQEQDSTGR